jgi:hypothetical protein
MAEETGFSAAELKKFSQVGPVIAGAMGTTVELWAKAEMGIILKTWAGETKVATVDKAVKRGQLAFLKKLGLTGSTADIGVTVNAGIKGPFGRTFLRTSTGGWRRAFDVGFKPVPGMPTPAPKHAVWRGKKTKGRTKPGDHYTEHDWLLLVSVRDTVKS